MRGYKTLGSWLLQRSAPHYLLLAAGHGELDANGGKGARTISPATFSILAESSSSH